MKEDIIILYCYICEYLINNRGFNYVKQILSEREYWNAKPYRKTMNLDPVKKITSDVL